jgi:hypothetical protein
MGQIHFIGGQESVQASAGSEDRPETLRGQLAASRPGEGRAAAERWRAHGFNEPFILDVATIPRSPHQPEPIIASLWRSSRA